MNGERPTTCHICRRGNTVAVPGLERLQGVTSDCRPWGAGARLAACTGCGCVQKVVDPVWEQEAARIYDGYTIYYQSGGVEQAVFDLSSGAASPRSMRLLERLTSSGRLPSTGRLLDIGCGNGALLRAAAEYLPGWRLAGTELDDRSRAVVEAIPGVEKLYVGPPAEAPGRFDLVTMVHVLEHLPSPGPFLHELRHKLADGGMIAIQIPEFLQNPFDLLIRDHCNHFTAETLAVFLSDEGFQPLEVHRGWVPKELTLMVRPMQHAGRETERGSPETAAQAAACVGWLSDVRDQALSLAAQAPLGLFGTSIAATWLASELGHERVAFFVDEDPHRIGREHLGRPVCAPDSVPAQARILVALPDPVGSAVVERLERVRPDIKAHPLPSLPESRKAAAAGSSTSATSKRYPG